VNHPVVEQLKVDQDAGHGISLENAAVDTERAEYRGALVLQNEEEGARNGLFSVERNSRANLARTCDLCYFYLNSVLYSDGCLSQPGPPQSRHVAPHVALIAIWRNV